MSNLEKVERVISKHLGTSDPYCITSGQVAEALEAAGLLMPDLPPYAEADADQAFWYEDTYGIGAGRLTKWSPVRVMLWDSEPGGVLYTDIESARDYALKILAACEYAEKEKE